MKEPYSDLPPCPPDCKLIPLSQGKFAIVDASRFEELNAYKWCYHKGYAVRSAPIREGRRKVIYMHRVVLRTPEGSYTDHKNGVRHDNRAANLRECTSLQNQQNKKRMCSCKSGFKGVSFVKSRGKWTARIRANGKRHFLGRFETKEQAAKAYAEAALKWHQEFARLE